VADGGNQTIVGEGTGVSVEIAGASGGTETSREVQEVKVNVIARRPKADDSRI
jgi:hypothetical protein